METSKQVEASIFPLNRLQRMVVIIGGLLIGDAFFIYLALWLAFQIRFNYLHYANPVDLEYYFSLIEIAVPVFLMLFGMYQLYSPKILFGGLEEYGRAFNAITVGAIFLILADFFFNRETEISRGWLLLAWVLMCLLIAGFRFLMRRWIKFLHRRGHLLTPAVIVNADGEGKALLEQLKTNANSGLYLKGFIDDNLPHGQAIRDGMSVIGSINDLESIVQQDNIEEVIVATGSLSRDQVLKIYQSIAWRPAVKLRFSSGLFEIISTGLHIKEMANVPLIEVNRIRITGLNAIIKSLVDFTAAFLGLILLSPLFLLVAVLIRLDSPGPVFYQHLVYGLNGEEFNAIKFRTMFKNAKEILEADPELKKQFRENFKLKYDPRITTVGKFLRRWSIDEFPQLFNVLAGQMSLVGPRFISPSEIEKYGKWQMNLFTVKPGLTGLWQVNGRSDISYEERIRFDMYYIRNWSLWLDIYLLLATIPAVISKKGAY
jgi:exopolysaccharide biosynthesis polyprenyl glycosylphosphotransferase